MGACGGAPILRVADKSINQPTLINVRPTDQPTRQSTNERTMYSKDDGVSWFRTEVTVKSHDVRASASASAHSKSTPHMRN